MLPFATEFPVRPITNPATFIAQVVAWLRGIHQSTVLEVGAEADLEKENALIRSTSGEELRFRQLSRGGTTEAIGFRHDIPDNEGRLWRTEAVVKHGAADEDHDLIRLRTQCNALKLGARLERPRKPFLIKSLLADGWGGADGELIVSDIPIWLEDSIQGMSVARSVTLGEAAEWLPTIYVSALDDGGWLLSKNGIEKLAYDLGGVAHVVVEPNRSFSFRLRDETAGANAYGGNIGLVLPEQGVLRRFHIGLRFQDQNELATAVRAAALNIRSQMPALGWEWTELQEQALRMQRERDRNRLSANDKEVLYQEEIENLQDKIKQLEAQISSRPVLEALGHDEDDLSKENLTRQLGPEIYPGEISDRLRLAAKISLQYADQFGLDRRSQILLQRLVDKLSISTALNELLQDLARSTKDPKRAAAAVTSLLSRHGYQEKTDKKHPRLEASAGYEGLGPITLSKTPSDHRALVNRNRGKSAGIG